MTTNIITNILTDIATALAAKTDAELGALLAGAIMDGYVDEADAVQFEMGRRDGYEAYWNRVDEVIWNGDCSLAFAAGYGRGLRDARSDDDI
jgi:hypothetical protein